MLHDILVNYELSTSEEREISQSSWGSMSEDGEAGELTPVPSPSKQCHNCHTHVLENKSFCDKDCRLSWFFQSGHKKELYEQQPEGSTRGAMKDSVTRKAIPVPCTKKVSYRGDAKVDE